MLVSKKIGRHNISFVARLIGKKERRGGREGVAVLTLTEFTSRKSEFAERASSKRFNVCRQSVIFGPEHVFLEPLPEALRLYGLIPDL